MGYKSYYEGGWKSGEAGGTPITPEALNHMDEGIEAANENMLNLQHITDAEHIVPSGANLNSYTTPGAYRIATASIAASLVNAPPYTVSGFRLIVSGMSGTAGVVQFAIFNHRSNPIYVRIQDSGGNWGEWEKIITQADATLAKELWNGSWSSGTLTVPDTNKYNLFMIWLAGIGTSILAVKHGTHIRGIGGYSSAAKSIIYYQFAATVSGNVWTHVACNAVNHIPSGAHGALSDGLAITNIYGLC